MTDWEHFYKLGQAAEFSDDCQQAHVYYKRAWESSRSVGEEKIAWRCMTRCEKEMEL